MKHTSRTFKVVVLIIATIPLLTVFAAMKKKHGAVTIRKDRIIIHGANITAGDEKRLNDILKSYDKSLYKIRAFKDGKAGKIRGTLNDDTIGKATMAEIFAEAQNGRLTGWTVQVGPGSGCSANRSTQGRTDTGRTTEPTNVAPTPTVAPTASPAPTSIPGGGSNPNRTEIFDYSLGLLAAEPGATSAGSPSPTPVPPASGGSNPNRSSVEATPAPGGGTNPNMSSNMAANSCSKAEELVRRLKPILEKYNKK